MRPIHIYIPRSRSVPDLIVEVDEAQVLRLCIFLLFRERSICYPLAISEFPFVPLTRGPRERIVVGCGASGAEGHAPCKDVRRQAICL